MAESRPPPPPRQPEDDASAAIFQPSQGLTQTQSIAQMEPTAAAALVGLHARGREAASMQVAPSSSARPLAAADRTLSLSSIHTDAAQSTSPFRASQGEEVLPAANGNGAQRARAMPLPLPMEDEEQEMEESDTQDHAATSSRAAAAYASAASPRPQVSIALELPSPSMRLPPKPSWAADGNRAEHTLRGRNREGHITSAQTTPHVQQQQSARSAAVPPVLSGRISRSSVSYTPQPDAASARDSCLCESDARMVTQLWREYLAKTDPHTDSPISSILRQVAEQIDWILDCLQTGLERRQQAAPSSPAQQPAPAGLDSISDKQIRELLAEEGPKQIHVVLKHRMSRAMVSRRQAVAASSERGRGIEPFFSHVSRSSVCVDCG